MTDCDCTYNAADIDMLVNDLHVTFTEIAELKRKLAKAMDVLVLCRDMFDEVAHPSDPLSVMLNTIVTELNGDKP